MGHESRLFFNTAISCSCCPSASSTGTTGLHYHLLHLDENHRDIHMHNHVFDLYESLKSLSCFTFSTLACSIISGVYAAYVPDPLTKIPQGLTAMTVVGYVLIVVGLVMAFYIGYYLSHVKYRRRQASDYLAVPRHDGADMGESADHSFFHEPVPRGESGQTFSSVLPVGAGTSSVGGGAAANSAPGSRQPSRPKIRMPSDGEY
jgi:hypothetical protein